MTARMTSNSIIENPRRRDMVESPEYGFGEPARSEQGRPLPAHHVLCWWEVERARAARSLASPVGWTTQGSQPCQSGSHPKDHHEHHGDVVPQCLCHVGVGQRCLNNQPDTGSRQQQP